MSPAEEAQLVVALEEMARAEAEITRLRIVQAALVEALEVVLGSTACAIGGHERITARAAIKLTTDSDPRNEVAS